MRCKNETLLAKTEIVDTEGVGTCIYHLPDYMYIHEHNLTDLPFCIQIHFNDPIPSFNHPTPESHAQSLYFYKSVLESWVIRALGHM